MMQTVARAAAKVEEFFFKPASPRPLAALRIGLSVVLLTQAFLLRREVLELFSSTGYVQGALAQTMVLPGTPTVATVADFVARIGISENLAVYSICLMYVTALLALMVGYFTRASATTAWLLHWLLMSTNSTTNYGADLFGQIFLFYLVLSPAGEAMSLDVLTGRVTNQASSAARLMLRVMQLHLCIMYLASSIEKGIGLQWWNGELLWRALNTPLYQQFDMTWLIDYPLLSKMAGWMTLLIEGGYCVFIWPRRTRYLWVVAVTSMHLGIALFLGLGVFGCMMAILTPALFGFSAIPPPAESAVKRPTECHLNLMAMTNP